MAFLLNQFFTNSRRWSHHQVPMSAGSHCIRSFNDPSGVPQMDMRFLRARAIKAASFTCELADSNWPGTQSQGPAYAITLGAKRRGNPWTVFPADGRDALTRSPTPAANKSTRGGQGLQHGDAPRARPLRPANQQVCGRAPGSGGLAEREEPDRRCGGVWAGAAGQVVHPQPAAGPELRVQGLAHPKALHQGPVDVVEANTEKGAGRQRIPPGERNVNRGIGRMRSLMIAGVWPGQSCVLPIG